MRRSLVFAALAAALGLAASGCHDHSSAPTGPAPTVAPSPSAVNPPATPPASVLVYVLNPKATGDEDLLIAHAVPLQHPETPAQDALTALLHVSRSPIAPGTALRGLSIDGSGVATVDLSQSPVKETGGEGGQSAALNAIALTLGQFPNISAYQIEVKGRPDHSFGEFDTDGPMDVIRPGAEPKSEGGGQ